MPLPTRTGDDESGPSGHQGPEPADAELFEALGRLLQPGGFVVDVGANEGQFIQGLRETASIRAVCLEPGSAAFARLQGSIRGLEGVEALNVAASSRTGTADLFISSSDVGSSLLRPVPGQSSKWATTVGVERCATTRIDELAESEGWPRIDLLKIDVQGSDLDVLESAGTLLDGTSIRAVLVEVNFHPLYDGQPAFSTICGFMEARDYFLGDLFRRYNRHGWLWCADALFLPRNRKFAT